MVTPQNEAPSRYNNVEGPRRYQAAFPAVTCSRWKIGGEKTGEFRRVIVECPGYTSQTISFSQTNCTIGQYAAGSSDQAYILGGAYTTSGSAGIDSGLQYTNAKNGYNGFLSGTIGGVVSGKNGTLPCAGVYQIAVNIATSGTIGDNSFVLNDSYTNHSGGNPLSITLMGDVSASTFAIDGTNWVARRCTCLAQPKPGNPASTSWFGFALNSAGNGPNLALPQVEYTGFTVSGPNQQIPIQVDSTFAFAQRNPPNENTVTLCGHDPVWLMTNFNTYEGFNLANPNTVGQFNFTTCLDN